ncbi:MAG TPA: PLDc N-terminal domain-containing protein [Gaiellaceae bacterium]|nr:PLDc N-terminal domain-containing protein [Gaiellaceae bacterium]
MYFGFLAIYLVLSVFFIADVLRQPATALSGAGKALWIVALLLVPVFAWIVYGIWRMRRSRGL